MLNVILLNLQLRSLEVISSISVVTLGLLAWLKFTVAEKLHSVALRTDGMSNITSQPAVYLGDSNLIDS